MLGLKESWQNNFQSLSNVAGLFPSSPVVHFCVLLFPPSALLHRHHSHPYPENEFFSNSSESTRCFHFISVADFAEKQEGWVCKLIDRLDRRIISTSFLFPTFALPFCISSLISFCIRNGGGG